VCYGLGGVEPTVTDADLLLGRLREGALLGDRIRLDRGAAERAIADLGAQIGLDAVSCASAILRIIDARMADLVRRVLVEQGLDARRFALVAFGGAGPLHVGAFASDVGVREVIISPNAAVLSAVGLAGADYRVVYLRSEPTIFPGSPKRIESIFRGLEKRAQSEFRRSGIAAELNMQRAIDMRFRRQTHRLTISITDRPVTEAALRRVSDAFETEYERVYGEGTAYRQAGIEASGYRVVATARRVAIPRSPSVPASASLLSETRDVYFEKWQRTAVFDAASLAPEQSISGPALVEALGTTVLIHPDQSLLVDSAGDLVMTIQP
jgi:N-methylhydantoinase A